MNKATKKQVKVEAPKVDWNREYPVLRESMRAFDWDGAVKVGNMLGARCGSRSDPEKLTIMMMHGDVEDIVMALLEIRAGVYTVDEERAMHEDMNLWMDSATGVYGGETRYWCTTDGVMFNLLVTIDDRNSGDMYFNIELVCAQQFF